MSSQHTTRVRVVVDSEADSTGIGKAKKELEGLAKAAEGFKKLGSDLTNFGKSWSMGVTAPIEAGRIAVLKMAGDFESGMNKVRALSGATGDDFLNLRNQAKQLGSTTQFSAGQAADAMGFLAMAGFKANDIYSAMPGTLDLAAASQVDLATSADIVSNILTGFKLEASDLGMAVDVLTETFTSSNTDLLQLGEAFKYAGPIANAAGMDFAETAAALGIMGNAGVQASMAGTSMQGVFRQLSAPSKKMTEQMEEMGISFKNADGSMKGMVDIVREFEKIGGGGALAFELMGEDVGMMAEEMRRLGVEIMNSDGSMRDMKDIMKELESGGADAMAAFDVFGARAGTGLSVLLGQGSGALEELTENLRNSEGAAKRVASIQMEGFNGSMVELKSAAEGLAITIGDSGLLDDATKMAKGFTELVRSFSETSPRTLRLVTVFLALASAMGPVLIVTGMTIKAVGDIITGFQNVAKATRATISGIQTLSTRLFILSKQLPSIAGSMFNFSRSLFTTSKASKAAAVTTRGLGVAFRFMLGPIGWVIAAVGLLYLAWTNNFMGIQDKVKAVVDWISKNAMPMINGALKSVMGWLTWLRDGFFVVWGAITGFLESVGTAFTRVGNSIQAAWASVLNFFGSVGSFFSSLGETIAGTWNNLINFLMDWVNRFREDFWGTLLSAIGFGVGFAIGALLKLVYYIGSFGALLLGALSTVMMKVATFLIQGIGNMVSRIWEGLKSGISLIGSFFVGAYNIIRTVVTSIPGLVSSAIAAIPGILSKIGSWFSSVFNSAKNFVFNTVAAMIAKISAFINWIPGALSSIATWFNNAFSAAVHWTWSNLSRLPGIVWGFLSSIPGFLLNIPRWFINAFQGALNWVWGINWMGLGWHILNTVGQGLANIGVSIKNAFVDAFNRVASIDWGALGRKIVDGVKGGLSSLGGGFMSGIKSGLGAFQYGTAYAPGGPAIVGESGPELVNLPRGSSVMNNRRLGAQGGTGGGGGSATINISMGHVEMSGQDDPARVADQLARKLLTHPSLNRAIAIG